MMLLRYKSSWAGQRHVNRWFWCVDPSEGCWKQARSGDESVVGGLRQVCEDARLSAQGK